MQMLPSREQKAGEEQGQVIALRADEAEQLPPTQRGNLFVQSLCN